MKLIFIKLLLLVHVTFSPDEIVTLLSPLGLNFQINQYDLVDEEPTADIGDDLAIFQNMLLSNPRIKYIFVGPPMVGPLGHYAGGIANTPGTLGWDYYIPDHDEVNTLVILHEIMHTLGAKHNNLPCNIMNPVFCPGPIISLSKKQIYRVQHSIGVLSDRVFRKLMRAA